MVTSRKPKSCHCQSRHCICVVKNAGERMSSSSSAKVILLKLVQIMEAEFLFFFPPLFPSVLVQAAVPAHSDFWEFCSDPSCVRTSHPPGMSSPQHLVLEQEQLMKEQELIISNKKSLATRHRLISANQSCFSTRLSKCSCC